MAKTKENGFKIVEKLNANPPIDIKDLSQELQCLLALGYLGGSSSNIYTEDIAVCLWEWFPKIYGWNLERYNKYPDKQMPKRGLSYLRTYEWAQGGFNEVIERDGWRLTPLGIDVYNMISHLHTKKSIDNKFSKQVTETLHKKIGKSKLYGSYLSDEESFSCDEFLIANFLGVRAGMSRQIRYKFFDLLSKCKEQSINEYVDFLNQVQVNDPDLLDMSKYSFESRKNKPKKL
tara:strand:+ start:84 stop:779 length:696 start_codon:yes stop_codon:yes gene_type:complete